MSYPFSNIIVLIKNDIYCVFLSPEMLFNWVWMQKFVSISGLWIYRLVPVIFFNYYSGLLRILCKVSCYDDGRAKDNVLKIPHALKCAIVC